jgi:FO synthase
MHAVARLHYATVIDNIQVSWVKMGVEGSRRILQSGANDLGGTLMDENISRAAGAVHGQEMDRQTLEDLVSPLGRPLVQRNTLYGRI